MLFGQNFLVLNGLDSGVVMVLVDLAISCDLALLALGGIDCLMLDARVYSFVNL
jgi:hypothetical protein